MQRNLGARDMVANLLLAILLMASGLQLAEIIANLMGHDYWTVSRWLYSQAVDAFQFAWSAAPAMVVIGAAALVVTAGLILIARNTTFLRKLGSDSKTQADWLRQTPRF